MKSLTATTGYTLSLPSGASHDGVIMSKVCPVTMLFLCCRKGLSHHPDQYGSTEDLRIGINVLTHFLRSLPA